MTGPKVVLGEADKARRTLKPDTESAWRLLGGMGGVFWVVAAADLALAWIPTNFGNPEWEFGTVTAVLNTLPLMTMGLMLMYGGAYSRGREVSLKLIAVILGLTALAVLAMLGLYLSNLSAALAGAANDDIRGGLREAAFKTVLQGLLYPAVYVWLAKHGWQRAVAG